MDSMEISIINIPLGFLAKIATCVLVTVRFADQAFCAALESAAHLGMVSIDTFNNGEEEFLESKSELSQQKMTKDTGKNYLWCWSSLACLRALCFDEILRNRARIFASLETLIGFHPNAGASLVGKLGFSSK
ncbi:hypothetical protein H5410_040939 [Solanum commersonii]|uniref:Uncharacterized protein n=1 Tax=Solanum commersonii TaxID=4109 RepID=A0A9J5XQE0_SOLCO|nr:hypothetical protein H5410_040939 [Solanum commersonii]